MKLNIIFLVLIFLSACTNKSIENERALIVGTWSASWEFDGVLTYGEMSYLPDNRKCTMIIYIEKDRSKVTYAIGEWRLKNSVLEQWSTHSTEDTIKIDDNDRDKVISVNENFLVLKSLKHKGRKKYTRYKVFEERGDVHCRNAS